MDNEKLMILQMLADGKIDAQKATELIEALDEPVAEQAAAPAAPAETQCCEDAAPAAPCTCSGSARPATSVEDAIEDIVEKSTEFAARVTDSAVKGVRTFAGRMADENIGEKMSKMGVRLGRIGERLGERIGERASRIAERVAERAERAAEKVERRAEKMEARNERHTTAVSPLGEEIRSSITEWKRNLHKAQNIADAHDYEDILDLLEEIEGSADEFDSEMDEVSEAIAEVRRAEDLSEAGDQLDEVIDHISEALNAAGEVSGYLSGLMGHVQSVATPELKEIAQIVVSTWPDMTGRLDGVIGKATAARRKLAELLREALSELELM